MYAIWPNSRSKVPVAKAFKNRIASYTARVNARLDAALPAASTKPHRLHEAMRYSVLNGGKRIRPLLVYAVGECLQVDKQLLDAPAVAEYRPAAQAVQLVAPVPAVSR